MPMISDSICTANVEIEITDRNMKAFLEVKPSEEGFDTDITFEELTDIISKKGITFGLNTELVKDIVENKRWREKILIAEGLPSVPGENARLEFNFPTDRSFRPQIRENGLIDYHEISIVNSVAKDGILIKKIAATAGAKGKTVLGAELPEISGTDLNVQTGPGVYKDPADNKIIKATSEGIIFYDSNRNYLEVQKIYQVKGSVDFSTGNINVKSSVDIQGDVKPGFSVKSPFNIQINGSVEQATISCEGTLKINKGVLGDNKQVISSGGDMHLGYVNNQILKCKGKMYIQTELRNSVIECCDEIVVVKNIGIILGGKIYVANKLTAANIGNKYNVATDIEVGMDFQLKDKYDQKKADLVNVHKVIENINKNISLISHSEQNEDNSIKLITLREEYDAYVLKLDNMKKDMNEFEKLFYNIHNPQVIVNGKIYPGTRLRIRHAIYEVKEELSHIKFVLENDEIVVKKL